MIVMTTTMNNAYLSKGNLKILVCKDVSFHSSSLSAPWLSLLSKIVYVGICIGTILGH